MKAGWVTKKLQDVCEIERGGSPRPIQSFITTDPKGINWIKIGDATASGKYIYKTEQKIKPEGAKRSRMVFEDDFILSNSMSFGRPYIMKTTGCIHDGWLVLRQRELTVNQDYLYHVLSSSLVFEQFDRLAAGSTVRNLNIGLVKSVEIPFPPLPEQERIVAILDQAFEDIATAKANAEKNLQNTHALFESHLQSIFTQRGEGWVKTTLDEVCIIGDGNHSSNYPRKDELVEVGIPFIRATNLVNGRVSDEEMRFLSPEKHAQLKKGHLKTGDILITNRGEIGKTAIVDTTYDNANLNSQIAWLRCREQMDNKFLFHVLNSSEIQKHFQSSKSGAALQQFTIKQLKALEILMPPKKDQQIIVGRLDALYEETQRLESLYQRKLAALDELKKSLLHRAFSGEL